MERPERPNVNLRVDRALHQRLIAEAKRSERSLNKECIWRLRQSIEAQGEDSSAQAFADEIRKRAPDANTVEPKAGA